MAEVVSLPDFRAYVFGGDFGESLPDYIRRTGKPCTVGHMGDNVVNTEVRQGHVIKETSIKCIPRLMFHHNKVPKTGWDILLYETGDFFDWHTDGQSKARHVGTLLLFPPGLKEFTGGDLEFKLPDGTVQVVVPSTFREWTLVYFNIDIPHRCTTVTSGDRIVYKRRYVTTVKPQYFANTVPDTPTLTLDDELAIINEYNSEKWRHLTDKVQRLQMKLACLNMKAAHFDYERKIHEVMRRIEALPSHVVVMVKGGDIDDVLFHTILRHYPLSQYNSMNMGGLAEVPTEEDIIEKLDGIYVDEDHVLWFHSARSCCANAFIKSTQEYNDNEYYNQYKYRMHFITVVKPEIRLKPGYVSIEFEDETPWERHHREKEYYDYIEDEIIDFDEAMCLAHMREQND